MRYIDQSMLPEETFYTSFGPIARNWIKIDQALCCNFIFPGFFQLLLLFIYRVKNFDLFSKIRLNFFLPIDSFRKITLCSNRWHSFMSYSFCFSRPIHKQHWLYALLCYCYGWRWFDCFDVYTSLAHILNKVSIYV